MAIEAGSGSRAERAPARPSTSTTSPTRTAATANSGSRDTVASRAAGQATAARTAASTNSGSRDTVASRAAGQASVARANDGSGSSTTARNTGSRDTVASRAAGQASVARANDGSGGGSGSRDTVAARAAGAAAVARANDGSGTSRSSQALYDMLAMDPVRGGRQMVPVMDAGYDVGQGAMRIMRVPTADPFATIDYHSRQLEEARTGIGAMPEYDDLASMRLWQGPGPQPMTQSLDMRQMRNPVSNIRAHEQQVSPFPMPRMDRPFGPMPVEQSVDMRQMRNPVTNINAHEAQVTPYPMDASLRPGQLVPPERAPQYRGPFVPSGRDLGAMPDFADMLAQLGSDGEDVYEQILDTPDDQPYPRPSRERPVDPRIVQTLLGEAANQGDLGIAAVAHSIMNRTERYGLDPLEVALERRGNSPYHQYSTWNSTANQGNNPTQYQPGDPLFERAEELYRDVRDNAYDFTGGATHYINPRIANPRWADPNVEGTEHLYDAMMVGDHMYFPRVPAGERANIPSNPALASTIAAGGIGPDPVRTAQAPQPRMRPASLGGTTASNGFSYGPDMALLGYDEYGFPTGDAPMGIAAAASGRGGLGARTSPYPFTYAGIDQYDVDVPERLTADVGYAGQQMPAQLPEIPTYTDTTMGGPEGPIPAAAPGATISGAVAPVPMPRPDDRDMSVWDNVSSAAGKVFENTAFGGALKAIFPEFYDGAGKAIMGLDDRGRGSVSDDTPRVLNDGSGTSDSKGGSGTPAAPLPATVLPTTPVPGVPGPDGLTRDANGLLTQLWWPQLRWPGQDYDPGVDGEWDYMPQFAEGGAVRGPSAPPATSGLDPRFVIILNAEDALKGQHTDPDAALKEFIDTFGQPALEALQQRVDSELLASQPGSGSRMIAGPGGPKDDAVPAVINDVQEARLSDGEFVVPAEAVAGAGEGDPMLGAERLTELSDRLGGRMSGGLRIDNVA